MKVGIVLPQNPAYSETFFRNKIVGLQEQGIEVTLYVKKLTLKEKYICPVKVHPKFYNQSVLRLLQTFALLFKLLFIARTPTIRIIKIARRKGYTFFKALKAAAIGASILPDKLDWLHFGYATAGLERELIGEAIGAKVAVSFRGYDISVVPIKNKGCYNLLFQQVDKVHTISSDLLKEAYHNNLPKNISVQKICPAINVKDFHFNSEVKRSGIITVGRLHWKKGGDYTLKAFKKMQEMGISITYNMVGEGDELERLAFAKYQLGLENIHLLGRKQHSEIPKLLQGHEIYVQYSVQEGFCNAVLEAQAMGLLCIVSDAEGLAENVQNGITGWVVEKRNPEALALKIAEVIKMPENEKEKIRHAAIQRVEKQFNLEKQRKEFVQFYTET